MGNLILRFKKNKIKPIKDQESCIICMDEDNCDIIIKLNCNHKFHKKCINDHINKGVNTLCPLCRSKIILKKKKNKNFFFKFIVFISYGSIIIPLSWLFGLLVSKFLIIVIIFTIGGIIFTGVLTNKIINSE